MFLVKWALLCAWLFVGMFVLPLKWESLTHIAFKWGVFPFTYALILTLVVFLLGVFKLKAN